jgi:hypothetical protein
MKVNRRTFLRVAGTIAAATPLGVAHSRPLTALSTSPSALMSLSIVGWTDAGDTLHERVWIRPGRSGRVAWR